MTAMRCDACGQENPDGFKFCGNCAAPLGVASEPARDVRKTVTVVFCDLTGSTALGAVTDPAGDDKGPGSYTYPTDGAFNPGSLDLTGLEVYRDGDTGPGSLGTRGSNGSSTSALVLVPLQDGRAREPDRADAHGA